MSEAMQQITNLEELRKALAAKEQREEHNGGETVKMVLSGAEVMQLRDKYRAAERAGADSFTFKGEEFCTQFAYYMLQSIGVID